MKLRMKFYLIYFVFAFIPLCSILYFTYHQFVELTNDRMEEYSENIFKSAVEEADNNLESISQSIHFLTFYSDDTTDSIVRTLKKFSSAKDGYTSYDIFKANQYCNNVFQNLLVSNEAIHGIYLFTPSNVTFSCSNPQYSTLADDYAPEKDNWYQQTLALNGAYNITTHVPKGMFLDDYPSIFFALSFKDVYTHEFLGVILVDCDPNILNLDNVNSLPDITLLKVQNKKNNSILYSNEDTLTPSFTNARLITKQKNLSLAPLTLTAVFDYDALFDTYKIGNSMLLSLGIICAVSISLLAFFITKTLVRPLENLSTAMAGQKGELQTFSSPYMERTDEIGTLYNEYANMLEEVNAYIKRDYKDKLILLDAQMKSLEARINSHFLFNTLESINSMAELEDNELIAKMSLALGNMFRYSIKTESELVTLQEELNHVNDYVSIQEIRFSNQFKLVVDIPQTLLPERVLKLILQPLVENALYHGLGYCTMGNQIVIHAEAVSHESSKPILLIRITDNGQGMSQDTLQNIRQTLNEEARFTELGHRNKQSIGLKNIHSRIELYYGKGYGLQIHSEIGIGTTVTIRVPLVKPTGT